MKDKNLSGALEIGGVLIIGNDPKHSCKMVRVESIPKAHWKKCRDPFYDETVKKLLAQTKGFYRLSFGSKKLGSARTAITARLAELGIKNIRITERKPDLCAVVE